MNSFPITNWDEIYSNSCSLDLLRHDNLINYPRCLARGQPYCVMCGKIKGLECEIPNQNKDVCKTCDSVVWKVEKLNIVVKFCKGRVSFLGSLIFLRM